MFHRFKNINFREVFSALFSKQSPIYVKIILILALVYLISPVDLLPDFLGPIGWIDDAAIVTALVTLALKLYNRHKEKHGVLEENDGQFANRRDVTPPSDET